MNFRFLKPKSFQIRWLDEAAKNALVAAQIPLDSTDNDGVFILAEDLPRVLSALDSDVVSTFPSPFKRIDEVVLTRRDEGSARKVRLTFESDQDRAGAEALRPITSTELLPFLKHDVVIHYAGGKILTPPADEHFHIFIDSAASETQTTRLPQSIFNLPVQTKRGFWDVSTPVAYLPSDRGYKIVDKATGFVAAELVDHSLYVHFNVLNLQPQPTQLGLFARLLKLVADQLRADDLALEALASVGLVQTGAIAKSLPIHFAKGRLQRFPLQTLAVMHTVLATQVKVPVVVHVEAGVQAPINDGNFHLYLLGSPEKTAGRDVPANVFGAPIPTGKRAWTLAAGNVPVYDGEFVVAQLAGMNNLYVSFDPLNDTADGVGNIRAEWEVLGQILRAALKELDIDTITRQMLAEVKEPIAELAEQDNRPKPTRIEIAVEGFSGRPLAVLNALTEQLLAPGVRMDVVVSNAKGTHREPVSDGRFHVFFHSSPMGERNVATPSSMFGIQLAVGETAFWPSGAGVAIADDTGFLLGELVGNNLYLHAQLLHTGIRNEARLLSFVMLAALREFAAQSVEGYASRLAGGFVDESLTRVRARIDNTAHNPFNPDHARESETALKEAIAVTHRSERALLQLEVNEQFGREYDELLAIDKVTNVTVGGGQIIVETTALYCRDDRTGHVHEIGAFKIQIPTEGGRLRWFNQTRIVQISDRKMNAPHVAADGHACEGTTKEEWPHFIEQRQFAYVVMKAIQFVESVNTGDVWGKGINHWPIASAR
jgi:hypothetical protein